MRLVEIASSSPSSVASSKPLTGGRPKKASKPKKAIKPAKPLAPENATKEANRDAKIQAEIVDIADKAAERISAKRKNIKS